MSLGTKIKSLRRYVFKKIKIFEWLLKTDYVQTFHRHSSKSYYHSNGTTENTNYSGLYCDEKSNWKDASKKKMNMSAHPNGVQKLILKSTASTVFTFLKSVFFYFHFNRYLYMHMYYILTTHIHSTRFTPSTTPGQW